MKTIKSAILIAGLCLAATQAFADEKALKIIEKVENRYTGNSNVAAISMSTCKFAINNGKLKCQSNPRIKGLNRVTKKYGAELGDSKSITFVEKPAAERDIAMLQYDYDDAEKDTEQWLFLPNVGKVKRVVADKDAPKKGSLFGTEFSLEDMEKMKTEKFNFRLIREESYSKRPTWVIEQTPTEAYASKTNYSKRTLWIDQERDLILKVDFYGWDQQKAKTLNAQSIKRIDGIWTEMRAMMVNWNSRRVSIMKFDEVQYNVDVADGLLTTRSMTDRSFKEQQLRQVYSDD